MVNKGGNGSVKRTGHRRHERRQHRRLSSSDMKDIKVEPGTFVRKYEIQHLDNAIDSGSDNNEEVSHKYFPDRDLPAKRANTRFRRHSTPAELQQEWLEKLRRVEEERPEVKRYIFRRSSMEPALSRIVSSDSESSSCGSSDNEEESELRHAGVNLQSSHHHSGGAPKLTRKQRRQQQLRKKKNKQLEQQQPKVKEVYADDSDSSIDLTEIQEIERKYFKEQRRLELQRLTKEWHEQMKVGGGFKQQSVFLPPEVLDLIFEQLQGVFSVDIIYVCKAWYSVGIEHLYREPRLDSYNYRKFVEALGNKSKLGCFVKTLNLRNIIQAGKPSQTAKLLRRCNQSLQVFIAPQTSFGYAPSISLKNCKNLKTLDLSLVSETVDLRLLFAAICTATGLERLDFPRSSIYCQDYDNHQWPQNIWNLGLSGGISNDFVTSSAFPNTITHLTLSHCPFISSEAVRTLCSRFGPNLTSLRALYPLPALRPNTFDSVFKLCPKLESFIVSVDYITRYIFSEPNLLHDEFGRVQPHPLKHLTIDSSGSLGQARKIDADDISLAVLDEKLPRLSHVRISSKMGWDPKAEEMSELAEVLDDNGGGVWIYNMLD